MPTNNPIAEPTSAAAANKPRLMIDGDRRTFGCRACPAIFAETGQLDDDSDGRSDAEVGLSKASTAADSDVWPDSGTEGTGLVGS
jgi:hypothetical protein